MVKIGKGYTKREMLALVSAHVQWRAGLLHRFTSPDYQQVSRVIFVCTGNICRSAYAQARWHSSGAIPALSCGVHAISGRTADPVATTIAAERQIDLSAHTTTAFKDLVLDETDLLACMDPKHARYLARSAREAGCQVLLLGSLVGAPVVLDPYGAGPLRFNQVFTLIDEAVVRLDDCLRESARSTHFPRNDVEAKR